MTPRTIFGSVFLALALGGGVPLACASSDVSSDPPLDAGGPPNEGGAPTDAPSDAPHEPPTCSRSKICVSAAPIDRRVNLTSVWGSSATDVWAVGTGGSILHYGGAIWEKADLAAQDASSLFTLRSVWLERADDVWILDGNSIRHAAGWKGPGATEWSFFGNRASSTDEHVATAVRGSGDRVWLARQANPWAFGPTLTKLGPWEAGGPSGQEDFGSKGGPTLTALAVAHPDEVWAVGENNVLRVSLRTEDGGSEWQVDEHDSRTTKSLLGVWGDADGVWLVGEGGVLRHMMANDVATKTFAIVPSPVSADLYGVFGFAPNDVWVVGEASTVLHWDGVRWETLSTPFDDAEDKPRLLAVWGSSPADVWIAGAGTLLHFQENAP